MLEFSVNSVLRIRIRDREIQLRDKHPGSATLIRYNKILKTRKTIYDLLKVKLLMTFEKKLRPIPPLSLVPCTWVAAWDAMSPINRSARIRNFTDQIRFFYYHT
jgi:hypothetical protein